LAFEATPKEEALEPSRFRGLRQVAGGRAARCRLEESHAYSLNGRARPSKSPNGWWPIRFGKTVWATGPRAVGAGSSRPRRHRRTRATGRPGSLPHRTSRGACALEERYPIKASAFSDLTLAATVSYHQSFALAAVGTRSKVVYASRNAVTKEGGSHLAIFLSNA
jgi:hypothetical protein